MGYAPAPTPEQLARQQRIEAALAAIQARFGAGVVRRGSELGEWHPMISEPIQPHASHCPECGAPLVNGMTCWEMLGAVIAWEYQDAELLAEHFLTVASYNLQHPAQFTEATLDSLRAVFIERLEQGLAIVEIRRRVGKAAAGATRVLKPEAERRPVLRRWPITIADVYLPEQPEGAAARVCAWAAAIRREIETD